MWRLTAIGLAVAITAAPLAAAAAAARHAAGTPRSDTCFVGSEVFWSHVVGGCLTTVEDIASSEDGWRRCLCGVKIRTPAGRLGVRRAVRYLRHHMAPRWRIWRGSHNRMVIHIALRRLLAWKKNPLNTRLTIKGVYTIQQIEKKFIRKVCPGATFINVVPSLPGTGGNPMAPDNSIIDTPLRFGVKGMTLRRFLTSGFDHRLVYPQHIHGGSQLWTAGFLTDKNGKPRQTFTLIIGSVYWMRLAPSHIAAATAPIAVPHVSRHRRPG